MTTLNKKRLLLTTLLSGAVIGFAAAPTIAQTDNEDEIVVTGSRIKKKDFTSNAPVATVEAVQFERTGSINTENLLNTLPQTVPGLDRTSNNPGNGSATVNLRGLGETRTLVLVDGIRAVPFSGAGVVDLNTIPIALIENVEVLTGGASSVYGSDAVAGVVNFIYNDSFEGVQADIGYQATQEGDANLFNAGVTMGANLEGGRGNVAVNMNYTSRQPLFQGDREFSSVALFNDGAGGLVPGGSSGTPSTRVFAGFDFGGGVTGTGTFEPDGSIRRFETAGANNDFYNYAPVNYIQLPQERFSSTALARYEINRYAEAYGRASFSSNKVDSQLAPTPIFGSNTFSLDGNPFLTPAAQQIISDASGDGVDTDGDGIDDTATAFLGRRLEEVGARRTIDDNQAFQVVAGLRGDVWFADNWSYDVYLSEGRTLRAQQQDGNVNRGRFAAGLLLADADGDGNVDLDANGNPTCAADPGGSTVPCAPLNIFGAGNISDAAAAYLRTSVAARATYEQTVFGANFSGDLGEFSINGDAIGAAFGIEYIENEFDFAPSQDLAASTIAGFNGSPAVSGTFDVWSAYGELSVPLFGDLPFAEAVTLDLAGRISEYSNSGTTDTWKIGGDWVVNDQFRIRGNYNTAVRAPGVTDLFSPQGQNFPGGEDPCSANALQPITPAISDICVATGVPLANVGSNVIDTISSQVPALTGGNPNLEPEEAKTWTIGAVVNPAFIPGFTLSVDYYDIEIENVIGTVTAQEALDLCYLSPIGGAGSSFCNAITRRPNGSIQTLSLLSQNSAAATNRGVDVSANYGIETADFLGSDYGTLDLSYLGTFNLENDFQSNPASDLITCAGEFGGTCGEPDPEYRHRFTTIWNTDRFSTQLVWRLVGQVDDDAGAGVNSVDQIDTFHYFDGSSTFDVNDNLALTFGVNNLFDEQPPIMGQNQEQANTYPATYDVFGRTFFANAKVRF